ncbi:MAG: trypsin-like peptidase domain-containing protein, partial [Planctomycetota bacterium]|nr:trypsin-like peptidase domain-containing protein [Planctomycetota bacterium]
MTVKHLEIKALVVAAATACTLFLGLSDSHAERYSEEVSLLELSDSIADLSATASRATVFIEGLRDDGEGRATGSGFVVDAMRGIVVTNAHVVGEHKSFLIRFFDGRETNGNVLGRDPQTD